MNKKNSEAAARLAERMAEVARKHDNDRISVQYARVAEKLEAYTDHFAPDLTKLDMFTIRVFEKNYPA